MSRSTAKRPTFLVAGSRTSSRSRTRPTFRLKRLWELGRRSKADGRLLVVVSQAGGEGQLSLEEFLERLGGEVPRWWALTDEYHAALRSAARNRLPQGRCRAGLEASSRNLQQTGWSSPSGAAPDGWVAGVPDRGVPDTLIASSEWAPLSPRRQGRSLVLFDASWPNLRGARRVCGPTEGATAGQVFQ